MENKKLADLFDQDELFNKRLKKFMEDENLVFVKKDYLETLEKRQTLNVTILKERERYRDIIINAFESKFCSNNCDKFCSDDGEYYE